MQEKDLSLRGFGPVAGACRVGGTENILRLTEISRIKSDICLTLVLTLISQRSPRSHSQLGNSTD